MPLNPSLILGYRSPRINTPDPEADQAKALQLRGLLRADQDAERSQQEAEAMRGDVRRSGGNRDTLKQLMLSRGDWKGVEGIEKTDLDRKKAQSEIGRTDAQTSELLTKADVARYGQHLSMLGAVQDPEGFKQWVQAGMGIGSIKSNGPLLLSAIDKIQSPQQFQELQAKIGMGMKDYLEKNAPKVTSTPSGGTTEITGRGGLFGEVIPSMGQSIPITQSANNAAEIAGRAKEGEANRGVQIRGQDLIDARSRENTAATVGKPFEVTGPDGQPMLVQQDKQGNITPVTGYSPKGPVLKPIPANVNTAIITNQQAGNQLDRALTLLAGNNIGDPKAGGMQGDKNATGWKGYAPFLNRLDPKGTDARAEIADIGSLKIHDRSGAAVTVSESPRLMPFIPLATDDAATVGKKLRRLKLEIDNESKALNETYSKEQGYRPSPVLERTSGGATGGWDAKSGLPDQSAIDAEIARRRKK